MRNDAFRPDDFFNGFARVRANLPTDDIFIFASADHRLGEVDGIGNDGHQCHTVPMPDEMLDNRCAVTAWNAVAADPTFLQVRGVDGKDVAVPLTRRK